MNRSAVMQTVFVYLVFSGLCAYAVVPVTEGLILHVSADSLTDYSDGDKVSVWPDLSGHGHDAFQGEQDRQPVFAADELNGKPAIRFDGINDFFALPELAQVGSVLVVLREHPDAEHAYRPFVSHALPGGEPANWHRGRERQFWSEQWGQPVVYNGQTKVDGIGVNGLTATIPTDYAVVSQVNLGTVPVNQIGRDRGWASRVWYGEIAELLLFDRLLSAEEENDVGWYLSQKYGLSTAYEFGGLRLVSPTDGGLGIALPVGLSWTAYPGADSYRVYGGHSLPLEHIATVSAPQYTLHNNMQDGQTTYFWQVEAFSGAMSLELSDVWSFGIFELWSRTVCPLVSDLDGDCTITLADLILFAEQWLAPGCIGFEEACADFVGDDGVNLEDFSILAQEWGMEAELSYAAYPVFINEIHYDPDLSYELVEFVELFNAGDEPIDISGWHFSRGISYTFPPDTVIPPGDYVVVTEDSSIRTILPLTTVHSKFGTPESKVYGPFTGSLSKRGETIQLRTAYGAVVDEVDYKPGFPWPTVGGATNGPGTGYSIQLVNPALDNSYGGNWRGAYPTPGAANAVVFALDHPPVIHHVNHAPNQPTSDQTVTISTKVSDPVGVDSVTLHYQIVDPGNYIPITLPNLSASMPTVPNPAYDDPDNWISVPMNDEGIDGDLAAGDNVYTVQIPADIQTHRRLIRYRITAGDTAGRSLTAPYPDDPQPNFAYFVYDGVPSWTGDGQTYHSETLTSLPVYHLLSRQTDVETCFWNSSWNTGSFHWVGTLVYDGQVYDHVLYRIRGWASTYVWGKNKIRFKFNRGHYFQARDDYGNKFDNTWRRLVLISGTCPWWQYPHPGGTWDVGTGGMVINEPLSYRFYNLAALPASHTNFFHFRVIDSEAESGPTQYDGDFWGLYMAAEEPDRRFLREHQLADGNIYKEETNQKRQSATQPIDGSDVQAFIDGLNAASPQSWWEANLNLDWYYTFRAVNIAINNSDMRPGYNCYYYCDPTTGKWSIHPWDMDLTFEWATHYEVWENVRYCLQYPDIMLAYKNRARELVDLLFDNEHHGWRQTDQLVDELASVIDRSFDGQRFVEAEKAMWNNHPRVSSRYANLWFEHNDFFTQPGRDKDWDNMLDYYKQYLTPEGMSGFLSGSYGLHALLQEIDDADIPHTPSITYIGSDDHPVNDLRFQTSDFSSPQGNTFAALKWRIAEVVPPDAQALSDVFFEVSRAKYEVETVWQCDDITDPAQLTVQIPGGVLQHGRYYRVRSRMKDDTGRWSHWSDPIQFVAGPPLDAGIMKNLRITEVMYRPAPADIGKGELNVNENEFEFIELKNTGTDQTLDLSNVTLTGGAVFDFADSAVAALAPGEFVLIVRNTAAFESRYPGLSDRIAGEFEGRLRNGGDRITLTDAISGVIADFAYSDSYGWPASADGSGHSLVPREDGIPTQPQSSLNYGRNWRQSTYIHGSPGAADPEPIAGPVVNEFGARGVTNWIELYNPTDSEIVFDGNWYLSDQRDQLTRFQIPDGLVIPAEGWVSFERDEDFDFGLSKFGEYVFLSYLPGTSEDRVVDSINFAAQHSGIAYGRYPDGGEEWFYMAAGGRRGAANANPLGPRVVLSEIMYRAPGDVASAEYIELYNPNRFAVALYNDDGPWRLNKAISYVFPDGLKLGAGDKKVVVGFDPAIETHRLAAFNALYGTELVAGENIVGPWSGTLSDTGGRIVLQEPQSPDPDIWYVDVDRVIYSNAVPWPTEADGTGSALVRSSVSAIASGDAPSNWIADDPMPGGPVQPIPDTRLLHYWCFTDELDNNTPFESLKSSFSIVGQAEISYESALAGYPFDSADENWRRASMERRNAPTLLNYRPDGNWNMDYDQAVMRGLQVRQPFTGDGGQNMMIFHLPTVGYKDMLFSFAAMNEGAAEGLIVEYSVSSGLPLWETTGLEEHTFLLTDNAYQLYAIDFSAIEDVDENADFKIRIRFDVADGQADVGDRVTFNNIALEGTPLDIYGSRLDPGDIAMIAMNAVEAEEFAWVPLVDIPAGTVINFTDSSHGTEANGAFYDMFRWTEHLDESGGGPLTWMHLSEVRAGTVIKLFIEEKGGAIQWNIGSHTGLQPHLSSSGDQIFVYQKDIFENPGSGFENYIGDYSHTNMIYGINWANEGWAVSGPGSTSDSYIPQGLSTADFTAVSVGSDNNYYYHGPIAGPRDYLLEQIADTDNWVGDEGYREQGYLDLLPDYFQIIDDASSRLLIHYWQFTDDLPNNEPLISVHAFYSLTSPALIEYQSALAGYPFDEEHENWRKASMERRNRPTDLNYRPEGNLFEPYNGDAMRGLQVRQPFTGDGGDNTMIFHLPTTGYREVSFSFAVMDEGAAEGLVVDYSTAAGGADWQTAGLDVTALPLETGQYQLYTVDFSEIQAVDDNPAFTVRIRFEVVDGQADDGDRVTFNNIALDGTLLQAN